MNTEIAGPHVQNFSFSNCWARDSAFLTNSQTMLMLPVWGPDFGNRYSRWTVSVLPLRSNSYFVQIFIQWKKKIHDGEAATLQENDRNVISLMLFKLSGVSSKKEKLQQQLKCRIINQCDLWSSLLVRDKYFRGRSPSGAARSYSVESLPSPCSVAWQLHTARNKNVTRFRQSPGSLPTKAGASESLPTPLSLS